MRRRYGWIPDIPDKRDFYRRFIPATLRQLPTEIDLRDKCPAVYAQGKLGSCTANAIGAAHQFEQMRQAKGSGVRGQQAFTPSRLFIYFNERAMEGTIDYDAGAYIRDGIKSVVKQGVCPETAPSTRLWAVWPYDIKKFAKKPPAACYKHALKHQALEYRRLDQSVLQLKGCLASGHPFVFGFSVYESFESKEVECTGRVPLPSRKERLLGGHAVMAVGYYDAMACFVVRNSWGEKWGIKGYCYMPYAYLANSDLAADFWTITLVELDRTKRPPSHEATAGNFAGAKSED
jgi:C1A family cysteine protease